MNMSSVTAMALSTATDLGLEVHEVPTEPAAILNHAFDRHNRNKEPKSIIGSLTVQLIRKKVEITQEQRQWVFDILQSLSKIAFFTAKVEEMLEIKFILLALMGEWKKASGPYAFPDPFPNDAAIILARVQNDLGFEDAMEPTPSPSPSLSPPPIPDSKKRKRPQETPTPRLSAPRRPVNMNETTIKALMRNITISDESSRRSYKLTDKSQKVDCDVVGDNGLKVGRWWPFRICALRDGAHGAMQGGIAGGATGGTYSIVVSRESNPSQTHSYTANIYHRRI